MKKFSIHLLVLGAFAVVGQIQATTIFYDNFDSENGGVTFLNYGSTNQNGNGGVGTYNTHFTNWTVTAGSVDIVGWTHAGATGIQGAGAPSSTGGAPDYDYVPGNGLYVDLDGTTGNGAAPAGTITSKGIPLVAGSYVFSFSLAGSQRGQTKDTQISVAPGVTNKTITLAASAPFTNYTIAFTLTSNLTVNLVFSDPDAANFVGALLDDVELDSIGCNLTVTGTVTNNVTCNGGNNGSFTVSAAGGVNTNYFYSTNQTSYQSSGTFSNLTAGTYAVYATNSAGCSAPSPVIVTITQPSAVVVTFASSNNVTCNGGMNGGITMNTATGGSGSGYTYSDGGAYQGSPVFNNLTAGTYTITAEDGNSCVSAGVPVTITQPSAVVVTFTSSNNVTCNGGMNGGITMNTATGGSGSGYTYSDGGAYQSGTTFSGLTSGTYTITAKDGNGCLSAGVPVTITQPSIVTVAGTATNNVTCNGGNNGSFTVNAAGGSGGSYLYSTNGTSYQASGTFGNLTAGTYTIYVTNSAGCSAQTTVTVAQPTAITITLNTTNQTTCAGSRLTWSVAASGPGTLAYQWTRDGTNLVEGVGNFTGTTATTLTNSAASAQDTQNTNDSPQGYVCVISSGACSVSSTPASLTVNPIPTVNVNSVTNCGAMSTVLTATTSASNPGYLWSDGETTASITNTPIATTNYTVTVTDGVTGCANTGSGTIIVNPIPTVNVNSVTNCGAMSTVLTATTSASNPGYLWSDGETTASITNTPAATTNFTVTVTDGVTGCANTGSGNIIVNPIPTVNVNSVTNCGAVSTVLTATTSASNPGYLWSDGETTASITNTPTATTNYTVTVTDGNTGCANTGSGNIIVNPIPTVNVNSVTNCGAMSTVLTATTSASNPGYLWSDGETTASITNTPAATTNYTVTVTDGVTGCANTGSGNIIVNPIPTVNVNSVTNCGAMSTVLTAVTSASNPGYLWSDGETTASITNTPAATTNYTVTVTDGNTGCANTGSGTIIVNPIPTVNVNSVTNCGAVSTVLTATTSASNPGYLWSDGETTASITNTPAATTNYTVTVTDGVTGCANTGSGTIIVNPIPTVNVNSVTNCGAMSTVLTATTSASNPGYLWSDGETTASITNTPIATTNYTVTVTDGVTGCANTGSGTIIVNPIPTVNVNSVTNCGAMSTVLTATTSASNPGYLWSDGETTASITNTPAATTNFTVTVTDGVTGCANTGSGNIIVNPIPTVNVNSVTNCGAVSTVLTATTSASNPGYLWSDGETTASITNTPTATTNYTVTVTDGNTGCANTGSGNIIVNPIPTVNVNSVTNCGAMSTVLTATTSASNPGYLWSDGETTASITNTPAATTNYTVTVTDGVTGCANTGSGNIIVNPIPTVNVNSVTNCGAMSTVLTAVTSASNPGYLWSDGETTASITNTPAATTNYTVTVTDGNTGCANTGSGTIIVNPIPTVNVNSVTNCGAVSTVLTATTSASNPGYLWSDGETTASITNTPTATTNFTVTVTDGNTGCANTGNGNIIVNPLPAVYNVTGGGSYCSGGSGVAVGLSGSQNNVTYQLFNGASPVSSAVSGTGNAISFGNQAAAGTYTVVATTNTTFCTAGMSGSATVTINPLPVVTIAPTSTNICNGSSALLTASGATTYGWSPATGLSATNGATVTASPTNTTTYTVTGTNASGCTSTATVTVTVYPLPAVYNVTGGGTYCSGGSGVAVGLSGSQNNVTYQLFNGASPVSSAVSGTGNAISFGNQAAAGTYTVLATTNTTFCTAGMSGGATVTVNPLPTPTAGNNGPVCVGATLSLSASGGVGYSWSGPNGFNSTAQNPTVSASATVNMAGTYTVTVTNASGCTAVTNTAVTVNPLPTVTIAPTSTNICNGSSALLTASGAATYGWSPASGLSATIGTVVMASPTSTTTYTVTGTNSSGCTSTATVTVTVHPGPTVTITSDPSFQFGSSGSGNGQFASPWNVALDGSGNIYVIDLGNQRIQKFDTNGNYILKWGSAGRDTGEFAFDGSTTLGIAVDGSGYVYVTDNGNNRIQKFDSSGNFILQWGTGGSGDGQFNYPSGVAIGGTNVYVVDSNNNRVQRFDTNGTYFSQWGGGGSANGQFSYPSGVAVDGGGSVYVADSGNYRIQKFNNSGIYQTQWGSEGSGNGDFELPFGVAVDAGGNVYVVDYVNSNIQKFDSSGNYLTQWSSYNIANKQFNGPLGLAVDAGGDIYVADAYNNQIDVILPGSDSPTICIRHPVILAASGAATYAWSPASGLSATTGAIVTANPTSNTTYTVTGSNAGGCTSAAMMTVSPLPTITLGSSPSVARGTTSASLPYTGATGSASEFSITYDATAHTAGFVDVAPTVLPASPLPLVVPAAAPVATYNATLTVLNAAGCANSPAAFTITVTPAAFTAGPAQIGKPTNGMVNITFFGSPSNMFVVQTTTNLLVPWWTLKTNTMGSNGIWLFIDPNATNSRQFYRMAQP